GASPSPTPEEKELDESRREVIQILKDLKQKHPEKELEQLLDAANYMALVHQQKSRAFYRIQATRLMTGAGNVLKKHAAEAARRSPALPGEEDDEDDEDEACSRIFFEPCLYHCLENCGSVTLAVACQQGLGANQTFYVDFRTEDGSAKAGSDYEYSEGTLIFKPGETRKELAIGIIDDDIFEEDEHFFHLRLHLALPHPGRHHAGRGAGVGGLPHLALLPGLRGVRLGGRQEAALLQVRRSVRVSECQGHVEVTVVRSSGARGTVMVPFRTVEGTARGGGVDYEDASGELEFRNDETAKTLQVKIVDDEEYEKKENFFIELGTPRWLKRGISGDGERALSAEEEEARRIAEMGKPVLGDNRRLEVVIEESYDFKNTVDKLMKKTNLATVIGTHSWREQFLEAITVSAGDEDEDDEGREERLPSCFDYVMHFLTVFWKVLFACVPPTALLGGWAAFGVSILLLALLTALIGDLAAHFGCTLGLKDSVNAVVFVALGTSIPDTFASRVAALQDPCADASIGNVTGSNAVNVFL
ncbi:NAC2 protein, partial [Nesospiza acunhae]|nr:NAC2 protein [Nesospiza acunhae]